MGLLRRRRRASHDEDAYGHGHVGAPAVIQELPPGAPPPVTDPEEQLRRLADLHDRGILSEDEFAEQKFRVLGL
jgi:hypothetical protein